MTYADTFHEPCFIIISEYVWTVVDRDVNSSR